MHIIRNVILLGVIFAEKQTRCILLYKKVQIMEIPRLQLLLLVLLTFLGFSMWAPMFCVPPIVHILTDELLITQTQASFLYASPTIMIVALSIPSGIIADRISPQKAVGIGITVLASGAMLRGFIASPTGLLGATFIYGIGVAWLFPTLPKMISLWFPREKSTVATGAYSAGMYIGPALPLAITIPIVFPIVGGVQGVFILWAIPSVICAMLWWALCKRLSSLDIYGGRNSLASVGKVQFIPMLRNKNVLMLSVLFLLHQFFFNTWLGWAPTLMFMKGATNELAGLISSVPLWVGIPVGILMPKLFHIPLIRRNVLWISSLALALLSASALQMNVILGWLIMGLSGVAIMCRFVTIMSLPAVFASQDNVGMASGLLLSIGYIGGIIGPVLSGYTLDLTGNLNAMLFMLIGTSATAVIISYRLRTKITVGI